MQNNHLIVIEQIQKYRRCPALRDIYYADMQYLHICLMCKPPCMRPVRTMTGP